MNAQVAGENFDPMVFKILACHLPFDPRRSHLTDIWLNCTFKGKTLLKHKYVCSELSVGAFEKKNLCFRMWPKIMCVANGVQIKNVKYL